MERPTAVGPTSDSERVREVRDDGRVPALPPRKLEGGTATDDLDGYHMGEKSALSMHAWPIDVGK